MCLQYQIPAVLAPKPLPAVASLGVELAFLTVCRIAGDVTGGALQQQQDSQPWASQSNPALEQARALLQRQLGSSPGADLHLGVLFTRYAGLVLSGHEAC